MGIYIYIQYISSTEKSRNHEGCQPPMVGSQPGLESGAAVGEVDTALSCIPNQPHVAAKWWLLILKAGGKWLSWLQQVCSEQIWLPEVQWLWQVRNHHFIRYISGVVFSKSTNLIHPTEQVNPEAVTREDRGFFSYTCDVPVSFRNWKYGTIKTLDSYTLVQTTLITVTNPSTTPVYVWTITLSKHARRI